MPCPRGVALLAIRLSEGRIEIANTVNWVNTVNSNKYCIFNKVNKNF